MKGELLENVVIKPAPNQESAPRGGRSLGWMWRFWALFQQGTGEHLGQAVWPRAGCQQEKGRQDQQHQ